MKYKILNTETTRDFADGLIGKTFEKTGWERGYIILNTCDGELMFLPDEVEEVTNND